MSVGQRRGEDDEVGLGEQLGQLLRRQDPVQHQRAEVRLVAGPVGRVASRASGRRRVATTRQPNAVASAPTARPMRPEAHDADGDVAQLARLERLPRALRLELEQLTAGAATRRGS